MVIEVYFTSDSEMFQGVLKGLSEVSEGFKVFQECFKDIHVGFRGSQERKGILGGFHESFRKFTCVFGGFRMYQWDFRNLGSI